MIYPTWLDANGKKIKICNWPDTQNETGQTLQCSSTKSLTMHVEYMGDRTECWVVVTNDGAETARHNARMIESIVWLLDPPA